MATAATHHVWSKLKDQLPRKKSAIKQCLEAVIHEADVDMKAKMATHFQGATLVCLFVKDSRTLHVAIVGDTRAVLCRNGTAIRLSFDLIAGALGVPAGADVVVRL